MGYFYTKRFLFIQQATRILNRYFMCLFVFVSVLFSLQMLSMYFVCVWFYDGLFRNMFIYSNKVYNLKSIKKAKLLCDWSFECVFQECVRKCGCDICFNLGDIIWHHDKATFTCFLKFFVVLFFISCLNQS